MPKYLYLKTMAERVGLKSTTHLCLEIIPECVAKGQAYKGYKFALVGPPNRGIWIAFPEDQEPPEFE